jgi:hypothetical protein
MLTFSLAFESLDLLATCGIIYDAADNRENIPLANKLFLRKLLDGNRLEYAFAL